MISVEEYDRLNRRVVRLEDFTDEEMALIARAEVRNTLTWMPS